MIDQKSPLESTGRDRRVRSKFFRIVVYEIGRFESDLAVKVDVFFDPWVERTLISWISAVELEGFFVPFELIGVNHVQCNYSWLLSDWNVRRSESVGKFAFSIFMNDSFAFINCRVIVWPLFLIKNYVHLSKPRHSTFPHQLRHINGIRRPIVLKRY